MKKALLHFPPKNVSYVRRFAPRFISRRFPVEGAAAYVEDGEEAAKKLALMTEIKKQVGSEIETRGYQNKEAIEGLITNALNGLKLDALRAFDAKATTDAVKKIAGDLEKLQQRALNTPDSPAGNPMKELIEKNWDKISFALRNKGSQNVVLNTRAAVIMDTTNVIDEGDIPNNILESFSVDSFIKKRRPSEYIFDVADRATVAEITEYKTWLEEGGEEGAFALVEQGAVKPLVSKSLVRNVSQYRKIAGKYVITEELEKFRKNALRILQQLFTDQLIRNYAAILTTDLIAKAAAYVGTALDGQYAANVVTDYHAIGAVAAQIESVDFNPDVLVINPQDKWRIGLSANSQGSFYMNIPMMNPSGEVTMMGFRLVTSNRITVGNFILGEGKLFKIEDEPVTIRIGYGIDVTKTGENVTDVSSDFDNNRQRVIAETFFHDYIGTNHAGSFVYASFADVKTALTA